MIQRKSTLINWFWVILYCIATTGFAKDFEKEGVLQKEIFELNEICDKSLISNYQDPKILLGISQRLLNRRFAENPKFVANGTLALAESQYYRQDYKAALNTYNSALESFLIINDTLKIANTLNAIGISYYILGNDEEAVKSYLEGFEYFKLMGKKMGMGQMYHNIALIYWRTKNYEKSDQYGLKAIELYKEIGEKKFLADMYNNYAVSLVKRKQYENGLVYYNLASEIYNELNDGRGKSSVIFNIGILFEYRNKLDSANYYFNVAHQAFLNTNDTSNLVNSYQKLARIDIYRRNYNEAVSKLIQSEVLNKKIGDIDLSMQLNQDLSTCYEALGDFQESLKRAKLFKIFNDSIIKSETQERIAEVESKFQVQQTKNDMAVMQQSSTVKTFILIFVFFVVALVAAALFFYWKSYTIKEEKRVLMLEHKVLRTQMDPHFIFNAMSALQCYIMDDKPDEAIRFLSDFSALLRLVLQYSKNELIPIAKEKKILDYYLSLQNKRFDNKIRFEIFVSQELLDGNVMIPPMLAQPFIENSLEHGGLDQIDNATILVNLVKEGNSIRLSVEDNGIGIEKALLKIKENPHKSMAISITHDRLKLLNSNQKEKVDLSITDLSHEGSRGTKVEFLIPMM